MNTILTSNSKRPNRSFSKQIKTFFMVVLLLSTTLLGLCRAPTEALAAEWSSDLKVYQYTFNKSWINTILPLTRKYKILPSLVIAQTFKETNWGQAETINYFDTDHNMSGITWPGTGNPDIKYSKGTARPAAEGSNYIHYDSVEDYFTDYLYLLRPGNNYNVSGVSDFEQAATGFFKVGGAKYDYAAAGPTQYVPDLSNIRATINKENDNALDKLDKLVTDGGTWKESNGVSSEDLEKAEAPSAETLDPSVDHTFQINGFGTTTEKDWDEKEIEAPTNGNMQEDFTISQKQELTDWIDEYKNASTISIIGIIRTTIQALAIGLLLFSLVMLIGYCFDRVGVLDFSLLSLITGGRIATAYDKQDQNFFTRDKQNSTGGFSNPGDGPKFITLSGLVILEVIALTVSYLTFSGKVFELAQFAVSLVNKLIESIPYF